MQTLHCYYTFSVLSFFFLFQTKFATASPLWKQMQST